MKKILMFFAAAALVLGAASCQKENFQKALAEGQEKIDYSDDPMGTIKVYIKKDDTKMDFTETDGTLSRKWKEGDVIDGTSVKDGNYKAFQYTVMDAVYNVENPYIVLAKTGGDKGVPSAAEGTEIHFVYAQGAVVSFNEENGTCTLDLSNQDEAHIPAVAVASGDVTIEDGKPHLVLDFTPVAAVLAIKASPSLKDFDGSTPMSGTFNKVSVSALTKGTMEIEDGGFVLKSVEEGTAIVTGVDGTKDIFAAVLPGSCTIKAKILDVKDGDTRIGSFGYEKSDVTVAADKYLRIKTDKSFTRIPVATIGTDKYATVDDAVDAANEATDDVTIKMLEDDESGAVTVKNINSKNVTLDLNGKTIIGSIDVESALIIEDVSSNGKISNSSTCLNVKINGSLTLNGGRIETDSKDVATVYVNQDAADGGTTTATFNGGQIIQMGETSAGALYSKSSTVTFPEGSTTNVIALQGRAFYAGAKTTLSISGGHIESQKSYPIFLNVGSAVPSVKIDGGTFVGVTHCLYMYSTATKVEVTGGKFDWGESSNFCSLNSSAKAAQVTVSGGYLTREPYTANFTMPEGYGVKKLKTPFEGKYNYIISNNPDPVVNVKFEDESEEEFTTLDAALAAVVEADGAATMTLYKDCEVKTKCDLSGNVNLTIDLNNCKLTVTGATRINIAADSPNTVLNIEDNSEEKNGKLYQKNSGDTYVMDITSGTFNLRSGCVDAAKADGGIRSKGGTINIMGGSVTGAVDYGTIYCNNEAGSINISGGTITSAAEKALQGAVRLSNGKLNISGGTITGAGKGALYMTGGTATISDGTFTTATYNNYDYRVCTIKNATVTMTGGTMGSYSEIGDGNYIYRAVYVDQGATFELQGGNLYARRSIFYCNSTAKVNMSGGTIRTGANGSSYNTFAFNNDEGKESEAVVTISGGNVRTYGEKSVTFGPIPSNTTVTLTGGNYTKRPSSYSGVTIPEDYEEQSTTGTYSYKIVKKK